jgi:hypothetical protein
MNGEIIKLEEGLINFEDTFAITIDPSLDTSNNSERKENTVLDELLKKISNNYWILIWNNTNCRFCVLELRKILNKIKKNYYYSIKDARSCFSFINDSMDKRKECRIIKNPPCNKSRIVNLHFDSEAKIINNIQIQGKYIPIITKEILLKNIKIGTIICIHYNKYWLRYNVWKIIDFQNFQQILAKHKFQIVLKYPFEYVYMVEVGVYTKPAIHNNI